MKTFDLEECADYLKVNPTTVQGLAAQGKIPGAKIGRAWVFMEEDVADYHGMAWLQCRRKDCR